MLKTSKNTVTTILDNSLLCLDKYRTQLDNSAGKEIKVPDRIEFRTGSEYPYNAEEIMYLSSLLLIVLVQILQEAISAVAKRTDKRIRN